MLRRTFRRIPGHAPSSRAEVHHRDDDFVFEAGFRDALAGIDEVVHVVERIEVADAGHAVLLEHLRVQRIMSYGWGARGDHVDAAGERLKARLRADRLAGRCPSCQSIFAAVLVERLETGAAAHFKVRDSGSCGSLDGGHKNLS